MEVQGKDEYGIERGRSLGHSAVPACHIEQNVHPFVLIEPRNAVGKFGAAHWVALIEDARFPGADGRSDDHSGGPLPHLGQR